MRQNTINPIKMQEEAQINSELIADKVKESASEFTFS
jgi:hypothetical protein